MSNVVKMSDVKNVHKQDAWIICKGCSYDWRRSIAPSEHPGGCHRCGCKITRVIFGDIGTLSYTDHDWKKTQ